MRMIKIVLLSTALIGATSANALEALRNIEEVDQGLRDVAIANEVRKKCDDISARMIRAHGFLGDLKSYAEDQGFTKAEIDAHVDDDVERARMKKIVLSYMTSNGVDLDDPQTYCALGHAEIARNSQIGSLLRAR